MKKILFVASECVPFIKTGGLADVVGSLPKAFDPAKYDVRVVIPNYTCIPWEYREQMTQLTYFNMEISWKRQYVGIKQLIYQGVTFYFIDNEYYFGGATPYGNMYADLEKFAFFSKAALAILPVIDFKPDVIHCHDWQAALVPAYLHTLFRNDGFYWNMKTIMTIHNLRFQGVSDIKHMIDISGLPEYVFLPDKMEAFGDANVLKGGLVFADCITTVSNTYAHEIQTPFYGENLNGLLYARRNVLSGIVNGIDYDVYNPDNDSRISVPYNADNFRTEKAKNKRQLQEELGLQVDDNKFVIGVISRMTDQKGFDLIDAVMDQICDSNTQFVLLGTGEKRYEEIFRHYESAKPGVSSSIYYNEDRSHRIYAGSDAILMPSAFEPCGLCQLMGLRYGSVPIVRETGGLKDTVIPYNEFEQSGTGFSFTNYNAQEMLNTINYAKHIFYDTRDAWDGIVERGMRSDYSWNQSAAIYEGLYNGIIAEKDRQDGYVRVDEAALAAAKAKEEEEAKKAAEEKTKKEAQKEAEAAQKKAAVEAKKKAAADTKKAVEAKVKAAIEPEQPATKKNTTKPEVKEAKAPETEAKKKRKRTTESDKLTETTGNKAPANEAKANTETSKAAETESQAEAKKATEAQAKKAAEAEAKTEAKKKAAEAEAEIKAKAETEAKKKAEAESKAKAKAEAKQKAESESQKAAETENTVIPAQDAAVPATVPTSPESAPATTPEIDATISKEQQPEVKAEEAPAKPAAAPKKRAPRKSAAKPEVQTEEVKATDDIAQTKPSKRTSTKSTAKPEDAPKKTRTPKTTKPSSKAAAKSEPETK